MLGCPYQNAEIREVVYSVGCLTCNKKYIGQTGRYLTTRMHEHQARSNSEVFAHQQSGHVMDMGGIKVIGRERDPSRRLIRETLLCLETGPPNLLNRNLGHLYLLN